MSLPSTAHSAWPSRLAYASALIFTGASGTLNVAYGIAKATDLPGQIVWGSVAAAIAVVLALSWAATIRAVEARRWAAAFACAVALLLSGAYSVTAALGSAAGGRTQAAANESGDVGKRQRAQKAYDDATAALAKMSPSRARAEIEADISGLLARNAKQIDCSGAMTTPLQRYICPRVAVLKGEIARTEKRGEMEKALSDAGDKLSAPAPPPANTDTAAIRRFAFAVGLDISADRLNDLLVLLAVLVVEFGGGLSLSVGMALSSVPDARRRQVADAPDTSVRRAEQPLKADFLGADGRSGHLPDTRTLAPVRSSAVRPLIAQPSAVQDWLAEQGGRVVISMRRLAFVLGRSPSAVHDELRRLQLSGVLTLAPGPRGTAIALRPN